MKSYVIKLEDKSAFTNICKSKNIMFKEEDFKTDRINDTFSFEVMDDEKIENIDALLKQHPNIDVLKRSSIKESHFSLFRIIRGN